MEASGTPTPQTDPPQAPPPPPPGDDGKASGAKRALAGVLVLVLAFGAAVMFVAGSDISGTPTLEEIESGEEPVPDDREYFDGSETKRTITTVLFYASGVFAALSTVLAFMFAITGNRGRLVVQTASIAIIIAVIVLII